MGFMVPVAEHMVMYHVETNAGEELVPESVCGELKDYYTAKDRYEIDAQLTPYVEGTTIREVERKEGWYGRLSAPGYLDCTEWVGPFESEQEALNEVKETYDVDDDGDEEGEEG